MPLKPHLLKVFKRAKSNEESTGAPTYDTRSSPRVASGTFSIPALDSVLEPTPVGSVEDENSQDAFTTSKGTMVPHRLASTSQERPELPKQVDFKTVALGVFKTILDLGSSAAQAEPVGIAKAVFDSVRYIVGIVETTQNNAYTSKEIERTLRQLSIQLRGSLGTEDPSYELVCRVDELIKELDVIFTASAPTQRSLVQNVFLREADAANLKDIAQKIRDSLSMFGTSSTIRQERTLHQLKKAIFTKAERDTLNLLKPVKQAADNSSRVGGMPICMSETRVVVLGAIDAWFDDQTSSAPPVFWVNGMAGVGKSTIAKTVANKQRKAGSLGASFFFSRRAADARLRDSTSIMPTIAYQLAMFNNSYKTAVLRALDGNCDIAELDLESQVDFFLEEVLPSIKKQIRSPLLVLDAFDECEVPGANRFLHFLLSRISRYSSPLLKILVTSRPEAWIQRAFETFPIHASFALHEDHDTEEDIQKYLNESLKNVPNELGIPLSASWLPPEDLAELVRRSGRLFVYAATVVRFVSSDPPADPRAQLTKALAPSAHSASVFADLDALYLEILTKIAMADIDFVRSFSSLLGAIILLRDFLSISALEKLLGFPQLKANSVLRTVNSLLIYPTDSSGNLKFYHQSFPEFILDSARCTNSTLHIDKPHQEKELAIRCLETMRERWSAEDKFNLASEELLYSCTYWASHLVKSPVGDQRLQALVDSFAHRDFLRWLEVMGRANLVRTTITVLQDAECWTLESDCPGNLSTLLNDFWRFVMAFSQPIKEGVEHISQSAIPFAPRTSQVWSLYGRHAPIKLLAWVPLRWSPLLCTMSGHTWDVLKLAFSPDGSRLASGSYDGTVRLWDVVSGTEDLQLQVHPSTRPVTTLAFTPNGLILASGSRLVNHEIVQIWDVVSGTQLAILPGHTDGVQTLVFSFDGSRLTSGSYGGTAMIWDVASWTELAKIGGSTDITKCLVLSPDGSQLGSASNNEALHLQYSISGMQVTELHGTQEHGINLNNITFSPDGSQLAFGWSQLTPYASRHQIELWDVPSGTQSAKWQSKELRALTFSPDGSRLAFASRDKTMCLWDVISGTEIAIPQGHSYATTILAFSSDGSRLASSALEDKIVRLWDVTSGTEIAQFPSHGASITALTFSPDGSRLASTSGESALDFPIRLWDVRTPETSWPTPQGHTRRVSALALSPDGLSLASGSEDQTVKLWDVAGGVVEATLEGHNGSILCLSFSPDGLTLVSCSDKEVVVRLWDLTTIPEGSILQGHESYVMALAFSPDGLRLVSGSVDGMVIFWDLSSWIPVETLKISRARFESFVFSADGSEVEFESGERWTWDVPPASPSLEGQPTAPTPIHDLHAAIKGNRLFAWKEYKGEDRECVIFIPIALEEPTDYRRTGWFPRTMGNIVAVGGLNGEVLIVDLCDVLERNTTSNIPVSSPRLVYCATCGMMSPTWLRLYPEAPIATL